jgi:hypothetical protein
MIDTLETAVFYDQGDFAVAAVRKRTAVSDVSFSALLATVDVDGFDGHAMRGRHELQYPTAAADLEAGDTVETTATNAAGTALPTRTWRVWRGPDRVVDGAESMVYLDPVSGA